MSPNLPGGRRGRAYVGSLTDVRHDTGENDLLFASGFDDGAELGIVPCVDLTRSLYNDRVGQHGEHVIGKWPVGSCTIAWSVGMSSGVYFTSCARDVMRLAVLDRGGHDDRKIKDICELSMAVNGVAIYGRVKVADGREEADLDVDNEEELRRCEHMRVLLGVFRLDRPRFPCQSAPMLLPLLQENRTTSA